MSLRTTIVFAVVFLMSSPLYSQWLPQPAPASGPIYYNGGNVGIGTSTPQQKLDIFGRLRLSESTNFSELFTGTSGGLLGLHIGTASSLPLAFYTANSAPQMVLLTSGSVGIGTTLPGSVHPYGFNLNANSRVLEIKNPTANDYVGLFLRRQDNAVGLDITTDGQSTGTVFIDSRWAQPSYGGFQFRTLTNATPVNALRILGNGYVGIGTTTPAAQLEISSTVPTEHVMAKINAATDKYGQLTYFENGTLRWNVYNDYVTDNLTFGNSAGPHFSFAPTGQLGIGTASPAARLHVGGSGIGGAIGLMVNGRMRTGDANNTGGVWLDGGTTMFVGQAGPVQYGFYGPTGWQLLIDKTTGNTGLGIAPTTAHRLTVNGDVLVTGNINAKYQDIAEWVTTDGDTRPGTVVILDPSTTDGVATSSRAYDTSVAGVISAQPGIALGESGENKTLVATTGRVKVRVTATRPIKVGDLLVTSDVPGTAMPSEPLLVGGRKFHQPGTILGKALQNFESGEGEILVLLSLQ